MPTIEDIDKTMTKVYYDDGNLFSRDKLFEVIKDKKLNITRAQMDKWLRSQYLHQLTKPPPNSTKGTRSLNSNLPFNVMAMDLSSMGDFIFLVLIDVFTRKAFVEIVRNKNAETVRDGINKIIRRLPMKPKTILSDNGGEFKNGVLRRYMEKQEIRQIFSIASNPQSNSVVERFNGSFKRWLRKLGMLEDVIDQQSVNKIVNNYNNSNHETIGMSPNQALKEGSHDIVARNLFNNRSFNLQRNKDDLKKGDKIRRTLAKDKIQKFSINWSMELYEIIAVNRPKQESKPIAYRIKNTLTNEPVKGFYGRSLLQKIEDVQNEDLVTVKFKVDKILRRFKKGRDYFLQVKWVGYNVSESTIEPENNIKIDLTKKQFQELMDDYKKRRD